MNKVADISIWRITPFLLFAITATTSVFAQVGLAAIMLFCFFLFHRSKLLLTGIVKTTTPILSILLIGIIFNQGLTNTDVQRDIFLTIKIIIFFSVGAYFSIRIKNAVSLLELIKFSAFIFAICHIVKILLESGQKLTYSELRKVVGSESPLESIFMGIMIASLFHNKSLREYIRYNFFDKLIVVPVLASSYILYYSRNMIVETAVVTLILSGVISLRSWFTKKNRNIIIIVLVILALPSFFNLLLSLELIRSPYIATLLYKLTNIPKEIFWTAAREADMTMGDINRSWRGYEAYRGIVKFLEGSFLQKIFGFGWGALVDLGLTIKLADTAFREIPILHNAYVYLLVKTGIVGFALYLFFLYDLGFKSEKISIKSVDNTLYTNLLSCVIMVIALNTFTSSGLFGYSNTRALMLGIVWGVKFLNQEKYIQNNNQITT